MSEALVEVDVMAICTDRAALTSGMSATTVPVTGRPPSYSAYDSALSLLDAAAPMPAATAAAASESAPNPETTKPMERPSLPSSVRRRITFGSLTVIVEGSTPKSAAIPAAKDASACSLFAFHASSVSPPRPMAAATGKSDTTMVTALGSTPNVAAKPALITDDVDSSMLVNPPSCKAVDTDATMGGGGGGGLGGLGGSGGVGGGGGGGDGGGGDGGGGEQLPRSAHCNTRK